MVSLVILLPKSQLIAIDGSSSRSQTIPGALADIVNRLREDGKTRESSALSDVLEICRQPRDFGGLGISADTVLTTEQESEIMFLVSAWLESLNSADHATTLPDPLHVRPEGRRGMTLSEKIFAMHDMDQKGYVTPGELIRTHVDWVIASEASWAVGRRSILYTCTALILYRQGMERTYNMLGKPGIFRNDRFWLAGDHVVDPRINKVPKVQNLIDASERAKHVFKMTDYQGMNVGESSILKSLILIILCSTPFCIPNSTASGHSRE